MTRIALVVPPEPVPTRAEDPSVAGDLKRLVAKAKAKRTKPEPPALPAWWKQDRPDPRYDFTLIKDTPLETIAACLCGTELDLGYEYASDTSHGALNLTKLEAAPILRAAIFALRRERADAAMVEEHNRLNEAIERLRQKREEIAGDLPRELRR
jgi:hypothetical protein